jgi:protein SCO1/2
MSKLRSNKKFLMGIAVAVLVPLFCFLVVSKLSEGKSRMPGYYGVERVDKVVKAGKTIDDTVYHQIADLVLTNQLGHTISLNSDLRGKMLVIDFFFTTCPSICPVLTGNMRRLQASYKKDPKKEASLDTVVQFISITVDPTHDSFQVLRTYADKYGVNHDHWWFLTGDKKKIYDFARNELKLTVGPGDGGADDFIHTEKMILIDRDRYIRGYYDGLKDTSVRKCADDIVYLTLERKVKK